MTVPKGFILAQVEKRTDWTSDLFSLCISGAPLDFKAGQFTKLALYNEEGKLISRAYSIVNAPQTDNKHVDFLIVSNPKGQLTPKLHQLCQGDSVWVGDTAHGDLIQSSVPQSTKDLWLLSTGTGIGPFLSLLDALDDHTRYEKIILVHGVRHQKDLVYRGLIDELVERYQGGLDYVPIISRQQPANLLHGRIPQLLIENKIQHQVQTQLTPEKSFVMLCGNPDMIKETTMTLQGFGLEKFRRATGGNIIFERYW
ncbi:ferredoxin--NADP reductase [Vibrio ostreicida]|uniref:ferredoxin--NADP reductase n=1 Tax=Vibrio ostreicida TaxID=526588 RepID=UPI003B5A8AA2